MKVFQLLCLVKVVSLAGVHAQIASDDFSSNDLAGGTGSWVTGWVENNTNGGNPAVADTSASNLDIIFTSAAGGNDVGGFTRQYDPGSETGVTVTFEVRIVSIHSPSNSGDADAFRNRFEFSSSNNPGDANSTAEAGWYVYGGEFLSGLNSGSPIVDGTWLFHDGSRTGNFNNGGSGEPDLVDSGIAVNETDTFRFTISDNLTVGTYVATVENVGTGESFTSGTLGYRSPVFTNDPSLVFATRTDDAGDTVRWVVDNISIVASGSPPDSDSDGDGLPDAWELANQLDPDDDGSTNENNGATGDPDADDLTNLQEYRGADGTPGTDDETDPQLADTDGDGLEDGVEVENSLDPTMPDDLARIVGIDFNRNDALAAPTQGGLRVIAGAVTQSANASTYSKSFGGVLVEVSQPGGSNLEFRGGNSDSTRAIPGGDTSMSFLVADFVATGEGAVDLTISNLSPGVYLFRSRHLEPLTSSGLGFAQGGSATDANTIEVRLGGVLRDTVVPTTLGTAGLGTTLITDAQVPTLGFSFTHDGLSPVVISLTATEGATGSRFLLLNGFEILSLPSP